MAGASLQASPSQLCDAIDADEVVWGVAFCPRGRRLATATDASVHVWVVSGDGRRWDRELVLWPGRSTAPADAESSFRAVTFSPDGRRVAAGGESGTAWVWDLGTGREVLRDARGVQINGLAFDGEGRRLAIAGDDGVARVVDATMGAALLAVDHDDEVTAVTFSADGRRVATASVDTTARIWDCLTGRLVIELEHPSVVWDVAFSPDGTRVATGGEDRAARLWNATTGGLMFELPHRRSLWSGSVAGVAFSPDGRRVASVGTDRTTRLWDAATGEQQCELRHADPLSAVAFDATGAVLATASIGVRLWRVAPDGRPPAPRSAAGVADERTSAQALPSERLPQREEAEFTEADPLRATAIPLETVAAVVVFISVFLVWVLLAIDATGGDKAWATGGAVAVGAGVLRGISAHARVNQAAVYQATLVSRRRLGGDEGWDCQVEVAVDRGRAVPLPLHAESKKPRGGFPVVLHNGDRVLQVGDDPRRADRAELLHPLEQYGLPGVFVFLGALAAAVPFMPG